MSGPKIYAEILGFPITETMVNTWLVMGAILIFAIVSTRNMQKVPGKLQLIAEMMVSGIDGLTENTMGRKNMGFAPYMLALFMYLGIANLLGVVALRPPTADLTMTFALSLLTFFMTQFFAIKSKGFGGFLKGFIEPIPLLLPINIIGELANPISLSFRLFGNMLGGVIIMGLIYGGLTNLMYFAAGIPILAHLYFDIFAGLLQSFIFVMLSMVFISMAMD
ncbi:F0F1 ATP synthase subunit A [Alkalibacter saccharofermentans]|uniref:ATP synthase subunit a n=1 Tax=Alkalibacter saccharofermentans DSM 14828 TaxID=1120975 RepID=A0A1M4Y3Q2_9FIRM|nr:F0F1 ATP synthase subunit A [Alkalibacter saccharofermentans]SHF00213.1 ATP synthase F0 subcomplex A subunit [Alkalibacter saccharofermentans DSM 14828]